MCVCMYINSKDVTGGRRSPGKSSQGKQKCIREDCNGTNREFWALIDYYYSVRHWVIAYWSVKKAKNRRKIFNDDWGAPYARKEWRAVKMGGWINHSGDDLGPDIFCVLNRRRHHHGYCGRQGAGLVVIIRTRSSRASHDDHHVSS